MEVNSSSNSTGTNTADIDFFCTNMPLGPLVWAFFCVPCVCVGVPASVWLLWVLIQRKRSGLSDDLYMINITVMDLIYNIFRIPFHLNFAVWRNRIFLNVCFFMEGFNKNGRPLFMACVCVDCYMAVVHPISYMRMKNSRYKVVVCALVWITLLLLNLYGFCKEFIHVSIRGLLRLLFISTIAYCDVTILRALRKPDPSGKTDIHPQKQRARQTITNSFIMTMVCYVPQVLLSLIAPLVPLSEQEVWCNGLIPTLVFSVISSTTMPLLHLGNLGRLKYFGKADCAIKM